MSIHKFGILSNRQDSILSEYWLCHYEGDYCRVLDNGCPRYNCRNEFIGTIGYCLDITNNKQMQETIRYQQDSSDLVIEMGSIRGKGGRPVCGKDFV